MLCVVLLFFPHLSGEGCSILCQLASSSFFPSSSAGPQLQARDRSGLRRTQRQIQNQSGPSTASLWSQWSPPDKSGSCRTSTGPRRTWTASPGWEWSLCRASPASARSQWSRRSPGSEWSPRTRTARPGSQWSPPDPITTRPGSECSPPDPNSKPRIRVVPAGPELQDQSGPCRPQPQRISEDILDRTDRTWERMSEDMPHRMPERMPIRIYARRYVRIHARKNVRVHARKNDFQVVCQKLCQNNGSGSGSQFCFFCLFFWYFHRFSPRIPTFGIKIAKKCKMKGVAKAAVLVVLIRIVALVPGDGHLVTGAPATGSLSLSLSPSLSLSLSLPLSLSLSLSLLEILTKNLDTKRT